MIFVVSETRVLPECVKSPQRKVWRCVCQAVNRGFQPSSLQQGALTPQQHSVMKQSTIKPCAEFHHQPSRAVKKKQTSLSGSKCSPDVQSWYAPAETNTGPSFFSFGGEWWWNISRLPVMPPRAQPLHRFTSRCKKRYQHRPAVLTWFHLKWGRHFPIKKRLTFNNWTSESLEFIPIPHLIE